MDEVDGVGSLVGVCLTGDGTCASGATIVPEGPLAAL